MKKLLSVFVFFGVAVFGLIAADLNSTIVGFRAVWPQLVEIKVNGNSVLLVDPSLISDKTVVSGGQVKFEPGKSYSRKFITLKGDSSSLYIGVTWIGLFQQTYLDVGSSMEDHDGYGKYGVVFCIPGNGNIYIVDRVGHTKVPLYFTSKYVISGDTLVQTPQALRLLDMESSVNSNLELFSDQGLTEKIASIAKGATVHIIGIEFTPKIELSGQNKVLLATGSGVVGWVADQKVASQHQFETRAIDILSFDTLSDP